MPQLLSRPDAGVRIGNVGDYPLQRHPDLALLVAEVIASWANVESFMLNLFVDLMGGPKDKAAIVFLSLATRGTRSAAIRAIADRTLSPENNKLLNAILRLLKTRQKARDKIAHGIWGDSPQLPDALLLADPRDLIDVFDPQTIREKLFVYKGGEFRQITRDNEKLAGYGFNFRWIVTNHPANAGNRLYDQLCREPEIQEILNRQA